MNLGEEIMGVKEENPNFSSPYIFTWLKTVFSSHLLDSLFPRSYVLLTQAIKYVVIHTRKS